MRETATISVIGSPVSGRTLPGPDARASERLAWSRLREEAGGGVRAHEARPPPGRAGGWGQQGQLGGSPREARLPGGIAPAQDQLIVLGPAHGRLPPALARRRAGQNDAAERDRVPAHSPGGRGRTLGYVVRDRRGPDRSGQRGEGIEHILGDSRSEGPIRGIDLTRAQLSR